MDLKKNLKSDTIDDAIKILKEVPGFSGDTFLEIFVRMKLHAKKVLPSLCCPMSMVSCACSGASSLAR